MIVSHTGDCLSNDSGLVLMKELMDTLQFLKLVKQFLRIKDKRNYYAHDTVETLEQIILQLIACYSTDSSENLLRQDWM